ncbi:MAG TPA: hypothetical protein VFU36_12985 [Jatrophihabitans sp.]|nr:hypothetical protein [Jatrophihabitans sp.]
MLAEHARRSLAEFTPPGLDGMLTAALDAGRSRRRWVWPAVAAVLLLAIPLVTVLLVRHGRTDGQPAQPAHSVHPVPNTTLVSLGPVPWTDPIWTGHSIWFYTPVPPSQYCKGVASIHGEVTEVGAASVTIVASVYSDLDPAAMTETQKQFCRSHSSGTPAGIAMEGSVELPEPLNGRSAFDGTAHLAHKVSDARMITSIPALPPVFHDNAYFGDTDQKFVGHDWVLDDLRDDVTLSAVPIDSPLGSSRLHQGKPSTIGLVNGQPTRLGPGEHLIAWAKGGYVYQIQETSSGGDYHRFSMAQLLDLARSVP